MGIKEEITKIAVEQGYEGAKPKSIAQAIDALTDTLAGEDVKSGRSVVDAIRKYAPYVGTGGGGAERVELFNETVTTEDDGGYAKAILSFTGDITDDPLVVVFDGTEYELPRSEAESLMGKTVTYGTPLTEDGPDFSTYPLAIKSGPNAGEWRVYTKTAGTHTIVAYTEKSSGGGFEPKGKLNIRITDGLTVPEGDYFLFCVDSRGPLQSIQNINGYGNVYQGMSSSESESFRDGNFGFVGSSLYVALAVTIDATGDADKVHVKLGGDEIEDVMRFVAGNNDVIFSFQVPEIDDPDFADDIQITYDDEA